MTDPLRKPHRFKISLQKNGDPIHKVSILPRGRALGVTQSLPERDRLMKKREYLEDQIAVLPDGRAAEQVVRWVTHHSKVRT